MGLITLADAKEGADAWAGGDVDAVVVVLGEDESGRVDDVHQRSRVLLFLRTSRSTQGPRPCHARRSV